MPDRVSSCVFLLTLVIFQIALAPVGDLEGLAALSTKLVSETERRGMLVAGTPHGPIAIDGDDDFSDTALLEGWPGDGSPEHPYIIDGLDIDCGGSPGSCISISNTRVSFTISNCYLTNASRGFVIHLVNVTNGELVNNTCTNNTDVGIVLWYSDSNTVIDNTCTSNAEYGICLSDSDTNTVVNNTCSSNDIGIFLSGSDSNTVSDNICNNNTGEISHPNFESCIGICLESSYSNTVVNNTCNSNDIGIHLWNSDYNTVVINTCSSNTEYGLHLYGSHHNTVTNNTCNNNAKYGISLYISDYNTATDNTCNINWAGIFLWDLNSNTVANNTCTSNAEYGICLSNSDYNTVISNTCNNNRIGIYLYNSDWNTVVKNTCFNNRIGIYLSESDSNTVANNITEFDVVVLLLIGLVGVTLLGAGWWNVKITLRGWRKSSAKGGKDDIIVPARYRLLSWFRKRRSIKHAEVDETLEPDSSDQ